MSIVKIRNGRSKTCGVKKPRGFLLILGGMTCLLILASAVEPSASQPPEQAVAVGEGFQVTEQDVRELQEFTESQTPFKTEEIQYRKGALKLRLFAEEARAQGLDSKDAGEEDLLTVERMVGLMRLYLAKVMAEYPLDDLVFESYYRAHPDEMEGPLDDAVKQEIRRKIMEKKMPLLIAQHYELLKLKYDARLCGAEGDPCR